ncbi:MAG: M3 family metallopeptidase [Bacteroidetes bacterium]|nr:M3 family metallopeptidase [Bacteroidota bacterium]
MKKLIMFVCIAGLGLAACNTQEKQVADNGNPFFSEFDTPFHVPPFDKIKAEHYMPAFLEGMKLEKAEIEAIVNNPEAPTFENTIIPYTRAGRFLGRVSSVFGGLSSANTTDELKAIAKELSPIRSAHSNEISLNPALFQRIKTVYEQRDSYNLEPDALFMLENLYGSFVRNGANLDDDAKEKLKEINVELSGLSVQFGQNLLGETNAYQLIIENEADLDGLPENIKALGAEEATRAGLDGKWVYTTQRASMYPFLTYAKNRDLRKQIYTAYTMRGDNDNERDNKKIASDIYKLRLRRANLLGYKTHADLILSTRMAKTSERVYDLLDQVWWPALEVAKKEVKDMQAIADAEGGKFKIAAWDWWYYAEKVRADKYNFEDSEIRPYFSRKNVQDAIFYVANQLYGITFTEVKDAPKPHPDAFLFEVKEADGSHLGVLYQDFYPRASKNGGAWCGGYERYKIVDGVVTPPIITMVTNVAAPVGDLPALLSIDDVTTVFHEFGHALDGLFSNVRYEQTFRSTDFTELPSQIMEHWAMEPDVLKVYAKHYKTGEVIPDDLIEKIQKSSLFNQGFITVEFVAAALIDMEYYTQTVEKDLDIRAFEKDFFAKRKLIPEIAPRYRTTYFSHIIGGYSAGYYSYLWSGVLDNDAFEAFKETSLFDQETAQKFRREILEPNGLKDPDEMYFNFRGRAPIIEPLLKSRGLK